MKKRLLLIVAVIIIAVGLSITACTNSPGYDVFNRIDKLSKDVAANNNYTANTPERSNYDSLCKAEYNKDIWYPVKKPSHATLHSTGFFGGSHDLSQQQMEQLLTILNDSANYNWGEFGTPEVHYYFTFYDNNNNAIGLTTIDEMGMAYSYPSLSRMKWGHLNKMDAVLQLIQEIK